MSLPYFPMFPSDFEAKTSHLTLAEDGAYNRLLRICWMTPGCTIPTDENWIMRRVRAHTDADKEAVRAILSEYFKSENGRYSNAKLMRVWLEANEAHEKRKMAGQKGGKAKSLKTNKTKSSNAVAMPKQPEPYRDTNVSHKRARENRFQEFWDQYPHRGGAKKNRGKCEAKYKRHISAGIPEQEIIAGAMRYATDRQVIDGYAKNPETWLNNEGWKDDIEPPSNPSGPGPTGGHAAIYEGFAKFANSEPDPSGGGSGGCEHSFQTGGTEMGGGPGGDTSQPILRVIGSE